MRISKKIKSNLEDLEVVESVKQGNTNAFSIIVEKYHEHMLKKVERSLQDSDAAKDVVQDALIKIYENINNYKQGEYTFNSWITSIVHNCMISSIREKNKWNGIRLDADFQSGDNNKGMPLIPAMVEEPFQESYDSELYKAVMVSATKLSDEDQAILRMFFIEEKKQAEIAELLGLKHSNVRVKIMRMKDVLKRESEKLCA